jgi:hypothetical protein
MPHTALECQASELVNSDACPRPTTQDRDLMIEIKLKLADLELQVRVARRAHKYFPVHRAGVNTVHLSRAARPREAAEQGPDEHGVAAQQPGRVTARSRCRFVLPRIHFIPYPLTFFSAPLFLKRQSISEATIYF